MFIKLKGGSVLNMNCLNDLHDLIYDRIGYDAAECMNSLINESQKAIYDETKDNILSQVYLALDHLDAKRINRSRLTEIMDAIKDLVDDE